MYCHYIGWCIRKCPLYRVSFTGGSTVNQNLQGQEGWREGIKGVRVHEEWEGREEEEGRWRGRGLHCVCVA